MIKRIEKIWYILNDMHFYETKGEGLFKVTVITLSWCGGVKISGSPSETLLNEIIAVSLFLFAISIIMEYVVQLVSEKKFIKKIIPGFMTIPSIFVFVVAGSKLLQRPLSTFSFELVYNATIFPQIIIWFDVFTQIFIEPPDSDIIKIGTKISKYKYGEDNE